ncbi:hypothetical protein CSW98_03545 [Vibrio sp. HA2012]|uniref:phosphatase PAP2 family protein n=1 Tax=Vibrio sp. HA2012 TaxID=1971595 RepID=UPI000C2C3C1D|nr:phosphatase PAP2 family protein [Vibrio sp. HA2012]PJC88204.1 hypothetical protein CSW98_03545 [Vibrio sp. HA2012]
MHTFEFDKKKFWFLIQAAGLIALLKLDQRIFIGLNHLFSNLPDTLWSFFTILGDGVIIFAIFPFLFRRYHKVMLQGLLLTVIALLVIQGLKGLFSFPRPPAVLTLEDFHLIGHANKQNSFPSGHSATAVSAAVLWCSALAKRWHKWLLGLAALVCLSRIAVGVHWPTDILVGAALGLLIGWITVVLSRNWTLSNNFYCKLIMLIMLLVNAVMLYDFNHGYMLVTNITYLIATLSLIATVLQIILLFAERLHWIRVIRLADKMHL